MAEGSIGSVGVEVVPDAQRFWVRFREQTAGGAAEQGRRDGNEWQRGFQGATARTQVNVRVDTKQAEKDTLGLKNLIIGLGAAAVPLAGAAALGGAAFVSLGIAGAFAIKGIEAEMKKGTKAGTEYAALVGQIKSVTSDLQSSVARGILPGAEQAVAKLHAALPALTADLGQSASVLGDITSHLTGAFVGGLHTFAPALLAIEVQVDKLAGSFEAWATGPGGGRFAASLADDFQHVAPLLEDLAKALAHVIAGANTPGLAIIDELDTLSKILDAIPVPVLTALTTGIASLKIAGLVSGLMDKLAVSVRGVAVAEEDAAVASTGFRGGLASTIGFLGKVTAGWLAFSVAAQSAAQATAGWQSSSNDVKRFFGTFDTGLADLSHFNFKGLWSDLFGKGADQAAATAGYVKALHSALDDMWSSLDKHQSATVLDLARHSVGAIGSVAGDTTSPTVQEQIQKRYKAAIDAVTQALGRQQLALGLLTGHATLSQVQTAYGASATALQKNVDATEKFLKVGGEQVNVYKGVSVTAGMYQIALKATGGNLEAATGYIEAQIDGLGKQKTALATVSVQQQRLGTFAGDMAAKYKLTTGQVDLYTEALGLNTTAIAGSDRGLRDAEQRFGELLQTLSNGSTALNGWIAAVDQFAKSADTAADRASLIGSALKASNGDMLSYANTMVQASTANQQLVTDFKNLKSGVLDLKTGTIDFHNAAAAPLLADLQNLQTAAVNNAAAVYQHFNAIGDAKAGDKAFATYVDDTRGALIGQYKQLGITKEEARKLADQYFGIKNSGDLKKQIELLGGDKVQTALQGILNDLDVLAGKKTILSVEIDTHNRNVSAGGQGGPVRVKAAGGFVSGPGTGTSDSIPARLSNGEFVVNARQTAKHRSMLEAMNSAAQGFAAGGYVGGPDGTNPFTGVDYSGSANKYGVDNKTGKTKADATTYTVAGQKYSSLQAAENAARRLFKADVQLGVKIDDKDLTSFRHALSGTVDQARAAFQTIYTDARKLGISDALAKALRTENSRLDVAINDRNKAADKLKAVVDKFNQVHDAVTQAGQGAFDVTTAGAGFDGRQAVTFDSLKAQQTQASNLITAWADGIKKLGRTFGKSKAGKELLQQLAEGGPSDYPEVKALLSASPKDLSSFVSTQAKIDSTASGLGTYVGNQLYGSQISQLRGEIRVDQRSIKALGTEISHQIEHAVSRLADRPVEIKVGDTVIARIAAQGAKKNRRRGG